MAVMGHTMAVIDRWALNGNICGRGSNGEDLASHYGADMTPGYGGMVMV